MIVKLLNKRHLEFLSITGGFRGPSESTLVKMSNCWKSRALAHIFCLGNLKPTYHHFLNVMLISLLILIGYLIPLKARIGKI